MNDTLRIVPMQLDDLDCIMEIEAASFTDAWTRSGFEESLAQVYARMYTAKIDKSIVGYCCLYQILDEGEIINVAIHPQWRGQGFGGRMLRFLLEEGQKAGVNRFILDVRESNIAAQKLYESAGFEKIALQKRFYDTPVEDGWLMELLV